MELLSSLLTIVELLDAHQGRRTSKDANPSSIFVEISLIESKWSTEVQAAHQVHACDINRYFPN
jgi:hypothetical protein